MKRIELRTILSKTGKTTLEVEIESGLRARLSNQLDGRFDNMVSIIHIDLREDEA